MKIELPNLKPYEIVAEIINTMIRIDRAITMETYVVNVVEHYRENILPEKQEIDFHVGRDLKRDMESNTQIIRRALDNIYNIDSEKIRFTSIMRITELKESLISVMIEPYKSQCLHILMSRYGRVPMIISEAGDLDDTELFIKLVGKASNVVSGMANMMENGFLDPISVQQKPKMLSDMTDLIQHIEETIAVIDKKVTY